MAKRLTPFQRELLSRAAHNNGGLRVWSKREDTSADKMTKSGLLRHSLGGYGSNYHITAEGLAALGKASS